MMGPGATRAGATWAVLAFVTAGQTPGRCAVSEQKDALTGLERDQCYNRFGEDKDRCASAEERGCAWSEESGKCYLDKCFQLFRDDKESCSENDGCTWNEEVVVSEPPIPAPTDQQQKRRRLEEESRPEATNNRVSSCPDGLLPDTFNQPAHGRGLCSPKHGNFAYLGLAGGGQRAKAFAQGILRGMWLRGMESRKYSMDRAAWPDNIGGNSGGTWGMMEVYTHGPKVVFGSEDSKTQEFWGRYVNPKKFGAVFNCMKEKHEDICFDPLHACNCGTNVPASFWDLTTPTLK